jgi:hypothetical protein
MHGWMDGAGPRCTIGFLAANGWLQWDSAVTTAPAGARQTMQLRVARSEITDTFGCSLVDQFTVQVACEATKSL